MDHVINILVFSGSYSVSFTFNLKHNSYYTQLLMPVATLNTSHKTKIVNCLLHGLSVDLKTKLQLKIALLKSPENDK